MKNFINVIGCCLTLLIFVSCVDDIYATEPPSQSAVSVSGTLPVLYIETENNQPIISKEEYLAASYWLESDELLVLV